jgi:ribosomal protection tetracycline resistance protein
VQTLNLGILAHVDAGKTTLTERLLHAAGVIDEVGSVDDGSTQTDSLALERERGITIKSAVVSFRIGDVTVNLIDTPGHPDFIAEVERVLSVLDGAVLVVSAVEGVQPQTRVLMRALQRLRVPTLIFVNKIDRAGAGYGRVLRGVAEKLAPAIIAMGSTRALGTRAASFVPHAPPTAASPAASSTCSPTTTMRCWPRTSTTRPPSRTPGSAPGSPRRPTARSCIPCTSARRAPAPAWRRS